jgi:hypothetical protein
MMLVIYHDFFRCTHSFFFMCVLVGLLGSLCHGFQELFVVLPQYQILELYIESQSFYATALV